MDIHTCTLHDKIGQLQPLGKFYMHLINPTFSNCALCMPTNQNSITLSWPARSPDLVLIEHVWDILGCNVWCNHYVKRMTALHGKWAAVPQNDNGIIIGLMRHRCTACMQTKGRS